MWINKNKDLAGCYYSILELDKWSTGMEELRELFPDAEANDLNFVLFSTSGVHGSYNKIEDFEAGKVDRITFVVVQPRIVCMRYGNVKPQNQDDIDFLKALRSSSWLVASQIGCPHES